MPTQTTDHGQPPPGNGRSVAGTLEAVMLAHADRLWAAERENAERFAARVRMVVPLCTAVLALLLAATLKTEVLNVFDGQSIATGKAAKIAFLGAVVLGMMYLSRSVLRLLFAVRGAMGSQRSIMIVMNLVTLPLLATDMAFLLIGLACGGWRREKLSRFASQELDIRKQDLDQLASVLGKPQKGLFFGVYKAAMRLREQNLNERQRIRTAERDLARGIIGVVVAILVYVQAILLPMILV
ncbi:MAG: hypothetical protein KF902_01710 [Phycisphaeraceae bacterium]|nr:hypothetical protein [Phycisphaeraceae bacterium]